MKNNDTCHRLIPYAFLLAASVLAAFSACRKDDATIDLRAVIADRPSGGSKVFVDDDNYACWQNGDDVKINGDQYSVDVDPGDNRAATISGVTKNESGGYTAAYPYAYVQSCINKTVTLTMPSTQTFSSDADGQNIVAPMAGYTDDPTPEAPLRFHNVAGVLKINVKNLLSQDLNIYALEIESSNAYIAGTGTVDGVDTPTPSLTISSDKTKNVMLMCNNTLLRAGYSADFYLVVAPFTDPTKFTVHVLATDTDNLKYTFHRESKSGITIARNQIGSISVELADDEHIHTGEAGNYFWGQGNEECPFMITCYDDLNTLRHLVNNSGTGYTYDDTKYNRNNVYYRQTADIDISTSVALVDNSNWGYQTSSSGKARDLRPIGCSSTYAFKANYDGGNHCVKKMYYNSYSISETANTTYSKGMFGYVGGGSICNLTVSGRYTSNKTISIGGLVGEITGDVTIDNCHSNVSITNYSNTTTGQSHSNYGYGGICGMANYPCTITRCSYHGSIADSLYSNTGKLGGILGSNKANGTQIKDCINYGNILTYSAGQAYGIFGGICAYTEQAMTIRNCKNSGSISSNHNSTKSTSLGGILGESASGEYTVSISYCSNEGSVTESNSVATSSRTGGIAGYTNSVIEISHCTNTGTVKGCINVAGILGFGNKGGLITHCLNTGSVTATGNASSSGVAGIAGKLFTADFDITNCKNTGNISSTTTGAASMYVAGIIGGYDNVGGKRFNLANEGTISAVNGFAIAGIDGRCNSTPTFANCYNTGKLIGKATHVAGILGYVGHTSAMYFNNCYNAGDMSEATGSTTRFSLIGYRNGTNNIIINCYHLNGVTNFQNNGSNVAGCSAITSIGSLVDNAVAIYTYNTKTTTGTSINNNNLCDALNAWCTDNAANGSFVSWSMDGSSYFPKLNLTF